MKGTDLNRLVPGYVQRFEAYVPSRPDAVLKRMYGCERLVRLNNNENPLGPPPEAQRVIDGFVPFDASMYPSGDCHFVREELSRKLEVSPEQILMGNGANEVIGFVIKAFCQEGDNIITADKTFAVYEWVAEFSGYQARLVPLKEYGFDDEGLLERIDERTKILFLCNPNNPTGSTWDLPRLRRFLDRVAGRQIVVVDEAYGEYVEERSFPDGVRLLAEYPNLVVFRTFSKMYGLAGLRLGYLVGSPEVVEIIRRTCVVYSVNAVAQVAAIAALRDPEHVQRTRAVVRAEKRYLLGHLERLSLPHVSGEGCFVMVRMPMSDTLAYRKLMARGVMIRTMTGFRFPNWIRVSMGLHPAMEALVESLEAILKELEAR